MYFKFKQQNKIQTNEIVDGKTDWKSEPGQESYNNLEIEFPSRFSRFSVLISEMVP